MLRIRDDVDLKELKKFGFKRKKTIFYRFNYEMYHYSYFNEKATMDISITTREIDCSEYLECMNFDEYHDLLYDLIKADLVEKVEE